MFLWPMIMITVVSSCVHAKKEMQSGNRDVTFRDYLGKWCVVLQFNKLKYGTVKVFFWSCKIY